MAPGLEAVTIAPRDVRTQPVGFVHSFFARTNAFCGSLHTCLGNREI
jgi:hypothetical protein